MKVKMAKTSYLAIIFYIILLLFILNAPGYSQCSNWYFPLSIAPHKIILNAELKGEMQNLQAIIPMPPATYNCLEQNISKISLYVDDNIIIDDALSYRYCYVDYNLLVSFSREEFTKNSPGEEIVYPYVKIVTPDYDYYTITTEVIKLAPGNKIR